LRLPRGRGASYSVRIVRRASFTFAHGAPGVGLLLFRLVLGIGLIARAAKTLVSGLPVAIVAVDAFSAALGILLLAGLWTPIAAWLVALYALGHALALSADRSYCIMVGILGVVLALLGPGVWSIDARLVGWRRLDMPDRKPADRTPP